MFMSTESLGLAKSVRTSSKINVAHLLFNSSPGKFSLDAGFTVLV